jgi:hypothetical protein
MRFVEIPYGRSDVLCSVYVANDGITNSACIDMADVFLIMFFTSAIFGISQMMIMAARACCKK